jgi:hypothetical protein
MVLEHLSVIHLVNCRVRMPNVVDENRTLSIVRCTSADRLIHEYFLRALHPVILSLPAAPSREQVSAAIQQLVDLFRRISQPPRKTVLGLWAELLIISRGSDPGKLVSCWHLQPEDRFDFSLGADRLEVKAAAGQLRIHQFSLEQLRPPLPTRIVVASLLTERTAGGTSIANLVDAIRGRIGDAELLIRMDSVMAGILGANWREAETVRYDLQLAAESLRFVDGAVLPAVHTPIPTEITEVRFRVDLSQHPLPFPSIVVEESELFRAAIPA